LIFELSEEGCDAKLEDFVKVFVSFKKFDHNSSAFFFSASAVSFISPDSFFNFASDSS
jgi:hypothetical protein